MSSSAEPAAPDVLTCRDLSVAFPSGRGTTRALSGLDLTVRAGEAYGLVGESGSGKSTVALAVMRYLGRGASVTGEIRLEGVDLAGVDAATLRSLRGRRMAMVYQDPMASLNPVMRIGPQLVEVLTAHGIAGARAARARALRVLAEVELPDPEAVLDRYPHQLSGGQQQRVVIAMALLAEPRLLIMDEPTTGLDVTVEAAVLDLVGRLRRAHGTAILFISHNLGAVSRLCDRVGVLYAGRLVEEGTIAEVLTGPRHPYTRALLACVPVVGAARGARPLQPIPKSLTEAARSAPGCTFAERCGWMEPGRCTTGEIPLVEDPPGRGVRCVRAGEIAGRHLAAAEEPETAAASSEGPALVVEGLGKTFVLSAVLFRPRNVVRALTGVDRDLPRGRTVAVVGESGSGKSTLARILLGLTEADAGHAYLGPDDLAAAPIASRSRSLRQAVQMVFQNPDSTLNPSRTVGATMVRTLTRLRSLGAAEAKREARRLLELVQLPGSYLGRFPDQLSGGQKQRVAIARALAADPAVILADEPVSALDVSVQAAVVNLLNDLQRRLGVALVFISHDLALVRYMADAVILLYRGAVVESGPAEAVFAGPYHPYTQALLAAAPTLGAERPAAEPAPPDTRPGVAVGPDGCRFAGRCPYLIVGLCETVAPPVRRFASGRHAIACHLPPERLPDRVAA